MSQRFAEAIRDAGRRQAKGARSVTLAEVVKANPLRVELTSGPVLDDDDFTLSAWMVAYQVAVGLGVGDTVLLARHEGEWVIFDALTDETPVLGGEPPALGTVPQGAQTDVEDVPAGVRVAVSLPWPNAFTGAYAASATVEQAGEADGLRVLRLISTTETLVSVLITNDSTNPESGTLHVVGLPIAAG